MTGTPRVSPASSPPSSAETLAVCVFCGSRFGASPRFTNLARDFGRRLGEAGWTLVYGGGDVGLMGVVASAALVAGGAVQGVMPRRLLESEIGKPGLTELVVTETMAERKTRMIERADAFVALPGGLGTLDELLEVVTLRQLGYHAHPIILLDVDGFWRPWHALLDEVVRHGFADATSLGLVQTCDGAAAAMTTLRRTLETPVAPETRPA